MSLGFDAISALPFATSGPDNSVAVAVTGNQLTITIGSVGIIADSIVEDVTGNALTLASAVSVTNPLAKVNGSEPIITLAA